MLSIRGVILISIILALPVASALFQPVGVIGRVKINGVYQDGVQVTIKNLNTGEEKVVITQEVNGCLLYTSPSPRD